MNYELRVMMSFRRKRGTSDEESVTTMVIINHK